MNKASKLLRFLVSRFLRLGVGPEDETPPNPGDDGGDADHGDAGDEGEGGGDGGGQPGQQQQGSANTGAEDPAKRLRKLERRIDNRTRALGDRERRIAQLEAEVEALRGQGGRQQPTADDDEGGDEGAPPPRGTKPRLVPVEEASRMAVSMAEERAFRESIAQKTTSMLKAGAAHENFRARAMEVAEDLPFIDRQGRPTPFISELLDCDAPHDVLMHIQENDELRDELAYLANNRPKLARRLAQVEAGLKRKTPQRSNAKPPLEPNKGGGQGVKDESSMSDAEWQAHRAAQRQKRA